MKRENLNQNGFTLIELLVVISIIGLLSSVVLATLTTAKLKAKDAVVKSTLAQMETLLQQEYADTGSYFKLQHDPFGSPWIYGPGINQSCTLRFDFPGTEIDSPYEGEMIKLCNYVVKTVGLGAFERIIYFGVNGQGNISGNNYSLGAVLPSTIMNGSSATSDVWCVGSSGKSLDNINEIDNTGCRNSP